jgi:hypothetical protein
LGGTAKLVLGYLIPIFFWYAYIWDTVVIDAFFRLPLDAFTVGISDLFFWQGKSSEA